MSEMIDLDRIRLDGGTQPRSAIFEETLNGYIEDMAKGDPFPPLVLYFDGTDYWLADGFHRYHAAKALGRSAFTSWVRQGTQRDAILYSAGANHDHGRPRTNEDKRRAVSRLLADVEWSGWSDREIARHCRVSAPLVATLRPAPITVNSYSDPAAPAAAAPPVERTFTTRHGTTATMNTAAIGRAPTPRPQPAPAPAINKPVEEPPRPTAEQIATFKEVMADGAPIADAVRAIVDAFAPLPPATDAARRYPRVLRHA